MYLNKKLFKRIVAFFLTILLAANPIWVRLALAEGDETVSEAVQSPSDPPTTESSLTPTPEPPATTVSETSTAPSEAVSPTPTPESTITTGDASAESEVETTINIGEDVVPGETSGSESGCMPPEATTPCAADIGIGNSNAAEATQSAQSSANTGDNESIGGMGDATIKTGDATASGEIQVETNTNILTLDSSLATESAQVGATSSEIPQEVTLAIANDNSATVQNTAGVAATTGQNVASENLGDAKIETGDALALVNILNVLNTNVVDANFEMFLLDMVGKQDNTSVDLNALWKEMLAEPGGNSLSLADGSTLNNLSFVIVNQSQVKLVNDIDVSANTGGNEANNNESAEVRTGDATALVSVTNIVNTNVFNATFFLGIINIFGDTTGDIILPRPERFFGGLLGEDAEGATEGIVFDNQNSSEITNNVTSFSETGENSQNNNVGDSLLKTGDALASTNTTTLTNLSFRGLNLFTFVINKVGDWQGKILNWTAPGAVEEYQGGGLIFQASRSSSPSGENSEDFSSDAQSTSGVSPTPGLVFTNDNQALVENNIQVSASTGKNETNGNNGDAIVETGDARASANLLNLVNINILGGHWFLGFLNILGDLVGNAIFAYPDLAVVLEGLTDQVEVGKTINFSLRYENKGHDETEDSVRLKLQLPAGTRYAADDSGLPVQISGGECLWILGKLKPGQAGNFTITVRINDDFKFREKQSFWSKIIPQAHAVESGKAEEITLIASIEVGDPETDFTNNTASAKTLVYSPSPLVGGPTGQMTELDSDDAEDYNGGDGIDHRHPQLEITAWNNVNGFVYLGDTVTFEITVKNVSDVPSYNTILTQRLYNGAPEDYEIFRFNLGTIQPGKKGRLSFGLSMNEKENIKVGTYHTVAQAQAKAEDGSEINSNEARTDFEVRKLFSMIAGEVMAAEEEKVLGVAEKAASCEKEKDILAYVLLLALSSTYLTNWARLGLQKKKKDV